MKATGVWWNWRGKLIFVFLVCSQVYLYTAMISLLILEIYIKTMLRLLWILSLVSFCAVEGIDTFCACKKDYLDCRVRCFSVNQMFLAKCSRRCSNAYLYCFKDCMWQTINYLGYFKRMDLIRRYLPCVNWNSEYVSLKYLLCIEGVE